MLNDKVISTLTNIITIITTIAALYFGAVTYVDRAVDEKIESKIKPYTELIDVIFIQQSGLPSEAATKLNELYLQDDFRKKPQEYKLALINSLLTAISDSGLAYKFDNTISRIYESNDVHLSKANLNDIASINMQSGVFNEKTENILLAAVSKIEPENITSKSVTGRAYWLLFFFYIATDNIEKAKNALLSVNEISPQLYNINDLLLSSESDFKKYFNDDYMVMKMYESNHKIFSNFVAVAKLIKNQSHW